MKIFTGYQPLTLGLVAVAMTCRGPARAQEAKPAPAAQKPATSPIGAINARYRLELEKLERQRLEQLGGLAEGQPKAEAEATYRDYFQLAIAKGLYAEAEPAARRLLKADGLPDDLRTLASLVKTVAEADRGAFDDSLRSLAEAVGGGKRRGQAGPPGDPGLAASSKAAVVEAYYQKLVRGDRYEVALKAMRMVAADAEAPAIRDLGGRRARQLELVGGKAPPIVGVDVDGKPFRLENPKGDVILVVFWASWCLPSAQEIPRLEEAYATYRDRGFRVVGVDVDSAQDGDADPKSTIANVRRFLLEFNVPWTILINGRGDQDLARAYAVTEIPANVLIGRDGKVVHLDLSGPKLDEAVAEAVGREP